MTFRWLAPAPLVVPALLSVLVTGCAPPLGRVLVTVVFENETQTQCIRASARNASGASSTSSPATIPREGKDSLRIGLGETPDLVGELQVTISRFSTAGCSGTAFDTDTQSITVERGAPLATLEFRFVGMTDGVDGGLDASVDGGPDAGCDVGACGNAPGECEEGPAIGCNLDGGCRFAFRAMQTACGDGGVCNSMGACLANVCAVLPAGSACDDQLPCTPSSACGGGVCQGSCATPPLCKRAVMPVECDPVTPSACTMVNTANGSGCGTTGLDVCLNGSCVPWVPYVPLNFPLSVETAPYPTTAWNLASPDGGVCDTVISTAGTTAMAMQGECGSPAPLTSIISDAGVMVITALGLDVGPNARLHFVGDKPVQLVVIGNASIRGTVSVAPLLPGLQPAGSASSFCTTPSRGTMNKEGGGGGGFGGTGGNGGEGMRSGGGANPSLTPFRGGCPGAGGFLLDGGVSAPGLGGGAIHLIVSDNLTLDGGIVTASGGGGAGAALDNEGAAGGGSGGTVILEARVMNLTNGFVTANGGGGGEGGDTANAGVAGAPGPINSANGTASAAGSGGGGNGGTGGDNAQPNGGNGANGGGASGGGGGGGAVGVIFLKFGGPGSSCKLGNVALSGVPGAGGQSIVCSP